MKHHMKRINYIIVTALIVAGCQEYENVNPSRRETEPKSFYATLEQVDDANTKVYSDANLKVLWNADDRIAIYDRFTMPDEYRFEGEDGVSTGSFQLVQNDAFVTGNALNYIYAVYPYTTSVYSANTSDLNYTITNAGELNIHFPTIQKYKENSFGPGVNVMYSVTNDNHLRFKNLGGYLVLKLYGSGVSVKSITLSDANTSATVSMTPDGIPVLSSQSKSSITLECDTPVQLSANSNECTEFWFVIVPTVFSEGFTITVDTTTGIFSKSLTSSLTVERNTLARMAPLEIVPSTGILLDEMYTSIGEPIKMYSNPDDWEFLMMMFCNDLEGADALIADSGYNWFSACGEYTTRNADYRNPYIRYRAPYNMIAAANCFLNYFPENVDDEESIQNIAQAKALRAYAYMTLAPGFQFAYEYAADQPCVPLFTRADYDYFRYDAPRATVQEVYEQIINDLNYAVEHLEGYSRPSKAYINGNVAHGLRARAYLYMGEWAKALADAQAAANGYTPASMADVSKPYFMDINEPCWLWGYDMTTSLAATYRYATTSAWLRSFSGWSYSAALQVYTCINKLLYDKIPATDVRKGWWVDENLESQNIEGLVWPNLGPVATADDGGNSKTAFLPYTNVKFGCLSIGTTDNAEDMPLMRVEEMILIQAECRARLGQTGEAVNILNNFVRTYRDSQYNIEDRGLSILDEIWFQRRIELWGEGFFVSDARRLNKPIVRFHDDTGNMPARFRFNLAADDPWLLLRFPSSVLNNNTGITDNTGGHQPATDDGANLRDGVTD